MTRNGGFVNRVLFQIVIWPGAPRAGPWDTTEVTVTATVFL